MTVSNRPVTLEDDILTLRGFGAKSVDKLTSIINEAIIKKEAELKNIESETSVKASKNSQLLEEVKQE